MMRSSITPLVALALVAACARSRDATPSAADSAADTSPADAAAQDTATRRVAGTVSYLQRIALAPGSVVRVAVLDVSRQDVAADTLADTTITTTGQQVPILFALTVPTARVTSTGRYAVAATIYDPDGRQRFRTTDSYPVLGAGGPDSVDVTVRMLP